MAQAVPGPLFTFSAYLGAIGRPVPGWPGALIALSAIHAPIDFALALFAAGLLIVWKWPPWLVVLLSALLGFGVSLL
jgi:chromate transporter